MVFEWNCLLAISEERKSAEWNLACLILAFSIFIQYLFLYTPPEKSGPKVIKCEMQSNSQIFWMHI